MIDFEKQIIVDLIKKKISVFDKTIEEAFMEHFGFPIVEVKDKEELEHIVVIGDPIESFRYRGETFLYWNKDPKIEFETTKDGAVATITTQFRKV